MEYWIVFSLESGAVLWRGSGRRGEAEIQVVPEGCGIQVVPQDALMGLEINLEPLRDAAKSAIDAEAGAYRTLFITDVPGQAQTYERKEAEARSWTDGADPALFPFMAAEAEASGETMGEVCSSILTAVATLTPIAARIEGHRMAAKKAINAAPDLLALIAAKTVNWQAVVAPAG